MLTKVPGKDAKCTYLGNEDNDDDYESQPRAVDTTDGFERYLVEGVSVVGPGLAETDMGQADGTPGEEGGHTRKLNQPTEDNLTISSQVHVCKSTHRQECDHGRQRAARAIHIGKDLGRIALLTESGESTRTTIDTRHADGDDRNKNDDIHEAVKALETGILANEHEGRSLDIDVAGAEQTRVVAVDEQADEHETENVEPVTDVSGGHM